MMRLFTNAGYKFLKKYDPPPSYHPPKTKGGGENKSVKSLCKKRHVRNLHGHIRTHLETDVMSATSSLAIEGVKDGDGEDKPTG